MRFTIRELVLVTAIVAMAVAWWVDRARLVDAASYEHEMLLKLRRLGLDVEHVMRPSGRDRKLFDPKKAF
jgi:hypothetical protein